MANWHKTIDLKDIWPDERPVTGEEFIKLRDEVVARFRASDWNRAQGFARRLANATSVRTFDYVMEDVWTAADLDRVWIATLL